MKILHWLLISLGILLVHGRVGAQVRTNWVGTYTWTDSERDGRPSKCDCDYYLSEITLRADSTCLMLDQRGRLSPMRQEYQRGTWTLDGFGNVELHITEAKGIHINDRGREDDPDEWHPVNATHHFHIEGYRLEYGGRIYD